MLDELAKKIVEFRDDRDWKQFHSPKNLATSISIQAAELLELFQWSTDESMASDLQRVRGDLERELADVLIYTLLLAHDTGIDLSDAVRKKLEENDSKYPASLARGSSVKYTELRPED